MPKGQGFELKQSISTLKYPHPALSIIKLLSPYHARMNLASGNFDFCRTVLRYPIIWEEKIVKLSR